MQYRKRLGQKVAEQRAFQAEQKVLRKKYKVDIDGTIKVQKKPVLEVIFENGSLIVRVILTIIAIILIGIAILALTYMYIAPEVPLKDVFMELAQQLKGGA